MKMELSKDIDWYFEWLEKAKNIQNVNQNFK